MGYEEYITPEVGPSTILGIRRRFPDARLFSDLELKSIWQKAMAKVGRQYNLQYPSRSNKTREEVYQLAHIIIQSYRIKRALTEMLKADGGSGGTHDVSE